MNCIHDLSLDSYCRACAHGECEHFEHPGLCGKCREPAAPTIAAPEALVIHCCAPNDNYGNPRRLFWVLDGRDGSTLAIVDEGYAGRGALRGVIVGRGIDAGSIRITADEYRRMMRQAKEIKQ